MHLATELHRIPTGTACSCCPVFSLPGNRYHPTRGGGKQSDFPHGERAGSAASGAARQ
jgi:hypothetical protein